MEDSVEQLRKELGELRREIQDLLEKQDRLQRRLEAMEHKAPWSPSVPSVATPAPASGAPVTVAPLNQAQPLSKRLDVALGAEAKRRCVEMVEEAEEEVHDRLPSRSPPSTAPGVPYVQVESPVAAVRFAGCLARAWDTLQLLLRCLGFRSSARLAWSSWDLLKPIQEVAFAFEHWFPSRILVLGGNAGNGGASRSVELFDGKWQQVADMDRGRASGAAVCTSDGRVLVMGGKDGDTALDSVEEYNLDSNTWQTVSPLRIARWGCAAVEFRNQVYVIGGRNTEPVLQCESLSRSEWCMAPSLIEGRTCPTVAVLGGDLFVLGGTSGSTVERLDLEASQWTIEPLPAQVPLRVAPTMAWSSYQGLVSIGGATTESPTTALARSECLKLQFGQASWVQLPSWRIPRLSPAAAVSPEGDIYILGGRHNKEASVLAERWALESHSWRDMPPMLTARESAACVIVRVNSSEENRVFILVELPKQAVQLANATGIYRSTLADALLRRQRKAGQRARQLLQKGLAFDATKTETGAELPRKGTAIVLYAAHDASITISVDGKIQCVLELERLVGIRYFWPPMEDPEASWLHALRAVQEKCDCEDFGKCPTSFDYGAVVLFEGPEMEPRAEYSALPLIVEKVFPVKEWRLVDHHEAHARMAFFLSPFRDALILSYDGGGNDGVFNVYYGRQEEILRLGQLRLDLGTRYSMLAAIMSEISSRNVSQGCQNYYREDPDLSLPAESLLNIVSQVDFSLIDHLSWTGKLMAYGALGAEPRCRGMTIKGSRRASVPAIEELVSMYLRDNSRGPAWMPVGLLRYGCESLQNQRTIAAAAQVQFETYVLEVVRTILKELGPLGLPQPQGLVVTGGCGLNVLANQLIHDTILVNSSDGPMGIYVPAAPNDSGLSVGGAWALVQPPRNQVLQYAGFRLWDEEQLEEVARAWGARRLSQLGGVEHLAELLSHGPPGEKPIVAVVRGRQEFGPRALGHRSLLAVPDSAKMRDRMNRLKSRQWFRPVAPMIADEALPEVFGREVKSPYMSMAPRVLKDVLERFPALSHLDGTARHQSVGEADEPWIHQLLLAVAKHTGLAALINTSFNARGQPIANSIKECLKMLTELPDLDYVPRSSLGNRFGHRKKGSKAALVM
ncbi:unnamed protein product [Cladocopium goreaui]|uniref:Bifunctional carbamoyltransferase TobZ n=1 Tax=Cladocopium goreaui TaxID=2562237 RepID=A0A9P1D4Z5_9DINO|nr:unnamed protein product [Cladocopium goreaui]